jgi:hypothetical protein
MTVGGGRAVEPVTVDWVLMFGVKAVDTGCE